MSMSHKSVLSLALILAAAPAVHAAGPVGGNAGAQSAPVSARAATPAERGAMISQFVRKWGDYVQQVYRVDVRTWSMRMVPQFSKGDSTNLRQALTRTTFEGAMAALNGAGHRVSDAQVIDQLAHQPGNLNAKGQFTAALLGDAALDLVFTPITPCRIVDTRVIGGPIAANSTRNFYAAGVGSYTSQGGSATNCGMSSVSPGAVALNVTAVFPSIAGYATLFPFGTAQPGTSSVNYVAGAIVNNAIIVKLPTPSPTFDFITYTFAQSDYLIDIVGYYSAPFATAVQCFDNTATTVSIAASGGTGNAVAAACPTGYTAASIDCRANTWDMPIVYSSPSGATCSAKNLGGGAANLTAALRCCRTPGR